MVCENCRNKPAVRGIKFVECQSCGKDCSIMYGDFDVCEDCSDKYGICRRCGRRISYTVDVTDNSSNVLREVNLYDRLYLSEYVNCLFKYLNFNGTNFTPSNNPDLSSNVILERSILDDGLWVFVKLGNKMRANLG